MEATIRLETGNRKSYLYVNYFNHGGIKCGLEYCSYPTKESGLSALKTLLKHYVNKYGYDYKAIRNEYCQCGEEDYYKFMEILKEIEREKD